ncbi:MAG TPA: FecR domain-containing protein, partial [Polyangiaceae bacterium]|nr:FecR domain-containing protein [Polyangiaceae bacterium]
MSSTPREPSDSRALSALTQLLRGAVQPPTEQELERGLNALRASQFSEGSSKPRILRWSSIAASVVLCLVLGIAITWHFRGLGGFSEGPVAVARVEGGKLLESGYLSESGRAGIKLIFNEGSEFALTPGTRGRLRSVGRAGATFTIDRGTASFRIAHSQGHQWSVEAGPFMVNVRGTEFTVIWDPASEQLEVSLQRGRVAVSGPVLSEELVLRPGQKLSVNLPKAETLITEPRSEQTVDLDTADAASMPQTPSLQAAPASNLQPPSSSAEPRTTPVAPNSATPTARGSDRRWREALASGQWDSILADVERDGVDPTLQTASSGELFALADAARYRRRTELARAALLAQRRRFPNSPRSLDAIFLLGRTEESRASGKREAISRYEEYLSRAPSGAYAAEALGRKMILSNELLGPESARRIADEYLRRFPDGS